MHDLAGDPWQGTDSMHARYESPIVGRFLSVDPGRDCDPKAPQSWNLYAYVRNNPIRYVDPTGKALGLSDVPGIAVDFADQTAFDFALPMMYVYSGIRTDNPRQLAVGAGLLAFTGLLGAAGNLAADGVASGSADILFASARKGEVLAALRGGAVDLPQSQLGTVMGQVQRATTKESVSVLRLSDGTVVVQKVRPGANGGQIFVSRVGTDGSMAVTQYAVNSAGKLVHNDPKAGFWNTVAGWFRWFRKTD